MKGGVSIEARRGSFNFDSNGYDPESKLFKSRYFARKARDRLDEWHMIVQDKATKYFKIITVSEYQKICSTRQSQLKKGIRKNEY